MLQAALGKSCAPDARKVASCDFKHCTSTELRTCSPAASCALAGTGILLIAGGDAGVKRRRQLCILLLDSAKT